MMTLRICIFIYLKCMSLDAYIMSKIKIYMKYIRIYYNLMRSDPHVRTSFNALVFRARDPIKQHVSISCTDILRMPCRLHPNHFPLSSSNKI